MKGTKNMEINKQLFEDILAGKLKGNFVLKNGFRVNSNRLCSKKEKNTTYNYWLKGFSPLYTVNGIPNSIFDRNYTIVDFIPETNMKENELTIEIPEGYELDKEKSTFEKIVFKKKDTKPRSWVEYCKLQKENLESGYVIDDGDSQIEAVGWKFLGDIQDTSDWRNVLPSKELAEAFLAMMQLISLREAWIGDWKPDWKISMEKWCVLSHEDEIEVHYHYYDSCPLTFPTEEMAEDFMNCFKDLLEIAKPLI